MSIAIDPAEPKAAVAAAEHRAVTKRDPFRLGWRYVTEMNDDGSEFVKQVPLTEWDVLHPEEGDFIVQNYAHTRDCIYIKQSVETVLAGRKKTLVLIDHRVDWQEPGVLPHGPDVSAFDDLNEPWDIKKGTFKVHDMGATVLLGVEVTSPATWKNDLETKVQEYHFARIPYYVVVDLVQIREDKLDVIVIGYRTTSEGFVRIIADPVRGIWIPTVGIGFKVLHGRVRCVDQRGIVIPDREELNDLVYEMSARIEETEKLRKRADERAETEKQRAEAEKQRADDAHVRIQQLEAELKNARG